MEVMNLNEFLIWLANSGGAIIIVSWVLERVAKYQALPADKKQWVFFGASFLISVLAYVILTYVPAEVLNGIAPYFGLLYTTFASIFIGTAFHKVDKLNK